MIETVKWGIIGCGDVTEVKSGPAFKKIPHSELVAVMRRNEDKARDYAIRHGVPNFYANASDLISDPAVNAVYIATPPSSHAEYAIKAMKAGKPVYVEKPMAATWQQCIEMNAISEKTGVKLFVAYYRRRLPGFVKIKDIIDSGKLGKILHFSIRYFAPPSKEDHHSTIPWRVNPEISGGGYVYDLGSHQLDLIDYLIAPVEKVSALTYNQAKLYSPEDYVSSGFVLTNGVTGNGVWNFNAPEFTREDTIEIIGSEGKVTFSCFGFTRTKLFCNGKTRFLTNPRPDHVQQPLIQTIVDELRGVGKCPSNGINGARTNKILELMTRA